MSRFKFKYVARYADKIEERYKGIEQALVCVKVVNWFSNSSLQVGIDYLEIKKEYPRNWMGLLIPASYIFKREEDYLAFKLVAGV